MAITYVCSFDHYGPAVGTINGSQWKIGNDVYLGDGWGDVPRKTGANGVLGGSYSFAAPAWGARAGDFALLANGPRMFVNPGNNAYTKAGTESLRLIIPGATSASRMIHFAFSMSELPQQDRQTGFICDFMNGAGLLRGSLAVSPSGRLQILDGTPLVVGNNGGSIDSMPVTLLASAAPVIAPLTWYFLSIQITTNPGSAAVSVQVYIGDILLSNKVLDGPALVFSDPDPLARNIDILGVLPASFTTGNAFNPDPVTRALRDIVITDSSGAFNTTLIGQAFVSAQNTDAEAPGGGWVANPRQNISDGVLDHNVNRTGLRFADAAALELGSGDFTFETWTRFHTLPVGPTEMNIFAKWRTNDNNRSYRLVYFGADNSIRWEVSTDGINITTVKRLPWTPKRDHWHHVAVVRSAGQTLLFIDGVQLGVPVADVNTYFNSVAPLGLGARFDGTSTLITTSTFDGWFDETRFTPGVARYTSDFTPPTAKLGRNVGEDPSFASVALLLGFDGLSLADESSFGRVVSTTAPAVIAIQPNDGAKKHNVLNARPPIDDTYIEAAQTFAEGVFTFDAIPMATETVTIGAQTYTWASPVGAANTVLIGASIADSIDNLIAAINGTAGEGTLYGTGTVPNVDAIASPFEPPQFVVRATAVGAAGNAVATTETMANGFWGSTTLTGGQDIPADSDFSIERLPNDVTGIIGVQVTTRQFKTDAGSAGVRVDFVGPAGAVSAGAVSSPDLNPAWARQVFEQDPDTLAGLTPSSIIGGRIRFKRTT